MKHASRGWLLLHTYCLWISNNPRYLPYSRGIQRQRKAKSAFVLGNMCLSVSQ